MNRSLFLGFILLFSCSKTTKVSSIHINYEVKVQGKGDYVTPKNLIISACNEFVRMDLRTEEGLNIVTNRKANDPKLFIYFQYQNVKAKISDMDEWISVQSNFLKNETVISEDVSINSKTYKAIRHSYSYKLDTVFEIIALKNYEFTLPLLTNNFEQTKGIPVQVNCKFQNGVVFKASETSINGQLDLEDFESYPSMTITEYMAKVSAINPSIKVDFTKLFYVFQP